MDALWQRHPALLESVSDQDLRWRLLVFLCNLANCGIIELLPSGKRAVRLENDTIVLTVLDNFFLLDPGVELDFLVLAKDYHRIAALSGCTAYLNLIDVRRPDSSILLHALYVFTIEVAHSNTSSLALLKQLF